MRKRGSLGGLQHEVHCSVMCGWEARQCVVCEGCGRRSEVVGWMEAATVCDVVCWAR